MRRQGGARKGKSWRLSLHVNQLHEEEEEEEVVVVFRGRGCQERQNEGRGFEFKVSFAARES